MNTKKLSLSLVFLSLCTVAIAAEYKDPSIEFKRSTPGYHAVKTVSADDEFKVESEAYADRQIASEKEREPSSLTTEEKKKIEHEKNAPKPWIMGSKSVVKD